jgi:hypothetical protein
MATSQRVEQGTDVQLIGNAAIGKLPVEFQQAIEMRKMQNQIAGQLASTNWGKGMDLNMRRAIADWGQQFRVDVTTEIHVLGGNIYLNAAFYIRQLSEMIAAGLVEYAFADHVEEDSRLSKLGPEGEGEMTRRLRERIKHGVPDKAVSAVVFRVKLRAMDREVVGVKWCGGGTRKNDPVGDDKPVETSESRAARRAMRLLTSHVPPATAERVGTIEGAAERLTERMHAHYEREANRIATHEARSLTAGKSSVPVSSLADPSNPYADVDPSRAREIDGQADVRVVESAPMSSWGKEGSEAEEGTGGGAGADGEQPRETASSSGSSFPLPFKQGSADKGTPLNLVSTKELNDAVRFAGDLEKFATFVENATEELERRWLDDEEAER